MRKKKKLKITGTSIGFLVLGCFHCHSGTKKAGFLHHRKSEELFRSLSSDGDRTAWSFVMSVKSVPCGRYVGHIRVLPRLGFGSIE